MCAVRAVLARLEDEDADVRRAAVEALGERGERVPLESLLARLEDENEWVRRAAARVLGERGEQVPLELLLAIFQHETQRDGGLPYKF